MAGLLRRLGVMGGIVGDQVVDTYTNSKWSISPLILNSTTHPYISKDTRKQEKE
jgi:hypothetical protein